MALPLGWRTDLAVLGHSGSEIEEHDDHVLIRTPANPTYHWGNFVLVTHPAAVDDAEHWLDVFVAAFPQALHRAIGLSAEPTPSSWATTGLEIEHEDVLALSGLPAERPLAEGYAVRPLVNIVDWEQLVRLSLEEHHTEHRDSEEFLRESKTAQVRMVSASVAAFFGVFAGAELVSCLGIVDCGGGVARYQSVLTAAAHRRRGLTSHLLGRAAHWAAVRALGELVIVADPDSAASRLYQSVGFVPVQRSSQAYRAGA
ncbi:MAG: GNAT family N-acetyltransferase [Actinomycetota bacterium]|nr:GNAT family N-acetyltransferase [Actinomycetota bacterium]